MCSDIARCSASWPHVPAIPQQPDGRIVESQTKCGKDRRPVGARQQSALVRSVQCGEKSVFYALRLPPAASRDVGRAIPGRAARRARCSCPERLTIPSGRLASSTDRGRRAAHGGTQIPQDAARSLEAVRSKGPRGPCMCSALPFGRYGASHGRKLSAWIKSMRSRRSGVS